MKEKIDLNVPEWFKACQNEFSNGFPSLRNGIPKNENSEP
jgi:hypothetical protein